MWKSRHTSRPAFSSGASIRAVPGTNALVSHAIWRAMAYAHQGRFAEAREGFRSSEVAIGALPIELQRVAKREALRCSIGVRDFAGASTILHDFETLGAPPELAPSLAFLARVHDLRMRPLAPTGSR